MDRIRRLEAAIESMAVLLDASIVPLLTTVEEVENGDDMALELLSAEQLGFRIQYTDRHGRRLQGIPPEDPEFIFRDVLSLRPEAGTMLRRGTSGRQGGLRRVGVERDHGAHHAFCSTVGRHIAGNATNASSLRWLLNRHGGRSCRCGPHRSPS